MKPTEMYFEPILIGFATLVIGSTLGSSALEGWLLHVDNAELAAWIAAAYFVGIIVDRLADTILDSLNHHHRLIYTLKIIDRRSKGRKDPFPEDEFHVATMENEQASDYVYYLRSRIRLMRAMLVLTPAAGVALAVHVAEPEWPARRAAVTAVVFVYVLATIVQCWRQPNSTRTKHLIDAATRVTYRRTHGSRQSLARFAMRNEWLLAGGTILLALVAGLVSAPTAPPAVAALMTVCTLLVAAAIAWCWWRVTHTYRTFLRNFSRF